MKAVLKIIATLVFCMIWGSIQRGCQDATRNGSGGGYILVNIFGLILLIAGIYGIWKFNPKNEDEDNSPTLKKD